MGLSSSQARLLNLTARMHDIEYKAQKLEAQKLQMANESRHVYQEYEDALNKTKIQFGKLTSAGEVSYHNATLTKLEDEYFQLKNPNTDSIYITPDKANKYHIDASGNVGSLDSFMFNAGFYKNIDGYNIINNSSPTTSYSPIATSTMASTIEVPNIDPNVGAQTSSNTQDTTSLQPVSAVSSFVQGQTYAINTKEDLISLKNLTNSGVPTQGVNFILGNDIDLSGENWDGIGSTSSNAFKGNFDGNGYSIKNLQGTTGLFKFVTGDQESTTNEQTGVTTTASFGHIKNVTIENANINTNRDYNNAYGTGVLIGKATTAYIENCNIKDSSITNAGHWVGGLIGWNVKSAIDSSTVNNIKIEANSCCVGGFVGHDTNGTISNSLATGNVNSSNSVGGFIGHETSSGSTFIYKCYTTANVSGSSQVGSFIGLIDSNCKANIVDSQAVNDNFVGSGGNNCTNSGGGASLSQTGTRNIATTVVTIPSVNMISSNINLMLSKSGSNTINQNTLNTWLNTNFYGKDLNSDTQKDQVLKLASLNNHIVNYIQNGSDADIVNKLITDINANTITNSSNYQNDYVGTRADFPNKQYTAQYSNDTNRANQNTTITIPSTRNIANNLYTALHNAGYSEFVNNHDVDTVYNWVVRYYPTNNLNKANLNALVTSNNPDSAELENLKNAIISNRNYTVSTPVYSRLHQDHTYTINSVEQEQNSLGEAWDTTNPEIRDAVDFYNLIKNGYTVISQEQADSEEWLTNIVNNGDAIMCQKNIATSEFIETNVATNTGLQEVSDEIQLKKAEAKYEADMRRINQKDKKFDTDLAAMDNERNAIKTEMETLKSVAKENVDRTFKLFS